MALRKLQHSVPKWRNGRRAGLKNRWGQPRVGSNPTFGTNFDNILITYAVSSASSTVIKPSSDRNAAASCKPGVT
jgi:hypothetical protein